MILITLAGDVVGSHAVVLQVKVAVLAAAAAQQLT
jgi:hypothetical protein